MRGWARILACMMGVSVSVIPVLILSLGVFIRPLGEAFKWGRAEIGLVITLICIGMALGLPLSGRLVDRWGVRAPLLGSLILFAGGVALTPSLIHLGGLAGLYVAAFATGVVAAPSSTLAYAKLLSGWFDTSRGMALGIATSGIAVGAAITPLIAAYAIRSHGWAAGFYAIALLPLAIGLPVAWYVSKPGLQPMASSQSGKTAMLTGMSFAEALRKPVFAVLCLLFLIEATAIHGLQVHLAPLLADRGLSPQQAALGVSFMFVASTFARFASGYLLDRIFPARVGALCYAAALAGMLILLANTSSIAVLMSGVALLGIGAGADSDLLAVLVGRYFGLRAFAGVYGAVFSSFMIGSALGPYLLGVAFDRTGSYGSALIWCVGGVGLTVAILLLMPRFPNMASFDSATAPGGASASMGETPLAPV